MAFLSNRRIAERDRSADPDPGPTQSHQTAYLSEFIKNGSPVLVGGALGTPGFDQLLVALHTLQTFLPYCQKALCGCRVHFPVQQTLYF
jgi:hypothetical protein